MFLCAFFVTKSKQSKLALIRVPGTCKREPKRNQSKLINSIKLIVRGSICVPCVVGIQLDAEEAGNGDVECGMCGIWICTRIRVRVLAGLC